MQIREGQQQLAVAAQKKEEAEAARFKSLVTMYETMKPRDAAKIFDRLEVNVLLQVASMMNPRSISEILALMTPGRATQRRARQSRESFAEGPRRQPAEDRGPSDRAVTRAHGVFQTALAGSAVGPEELKSNQEEPRVRHGRTCSGHPRLCSSWQVRRGCPRQARA